MKSKNTHTIIRKISWIVLAFGIVALCIAAMEHKSEVYVKAVETRVHMLQSGANLITQDDILKELETSFGEVTSMKISMLDADLMEETIQKNPFMKSVDVYIDAHNILHVDVRQREPIVRVVDNGGAHFYLDVTGVKVPVSPHYTPRVPIANGLIIPMEADRINEESPVNYQTLFALAKVIYQDPFLKSLISQIYMDAKLGAIWIPKVGASEIVVGDEEEISDKVERLKIFYKEGIPSVGWNTYKRLDLRFAGQVIGKKA